MFFIATVSSKNNSVPFDQMKTCPNCQNLTGGEIIESYSVFNLFFIPLFKFNKKYFLKFNCCDSFYELSKEKGYKFFNGEKVIINGEDLKAIFIGIKLPTKEESTPTANDDSTCDEDFVICSYCGHKSSKEYVFCPMCSKKLNK